VESRAGRTETAEAGGERPARGGAWWCFLAGLGVYWLAQWLHTGELFAQSRWPYYVYYARALLEGQLHFSVLPPAALDLAVYQGRHYLYHPPFPSLLLLPLVAAGGLDVPDRFVALLLGGANGALFHRLLAALDREGIARSGERDRLLLCALFLFGTAHCYLAITANHWELSHLVCIGLVLLALRAALDGRLVLAALCYAGVLWTRSHVVLSSVAALLFFLEAQRRRGAQPAASLRRLLPAAAVGALALLLLLLFDAARFGDPFESGTSHQRMHEMFRADFERYGLFDVAYLPRNLAALLLATPRPSESFPFLEFSPQGLSIFLATPFYLYLLRSLRRATRREALLLWTGVLPALLPVLLTIGTGALQFGHRYSADLQPLLIPLAWLGAGQRFSRVGYALLAGSLAMNALGAAWFVSRYAS
jgi:hypothetical protein